METDDIRWQQRFDNFQRAMHTVTDAVALAATRKLTPLEQQGLIQGFEFTHELAWNVLKDYLDSKGIAGLVGSRDATRAAFQNGLISDGHVWMDMIAARNRSSHTYNLDTAEAIVGDVITRFHPAFMELAQKFSALRHA